MCAAFDKQLYKCGIEFLGLDYVKRICSYRGVGDEFARHVRKVHVDSWFTLNDGQITFQWKLPYVGNRMNICVLHSDNKDYLYKVHYQKESQSLRHIVVCLDDIEEEQQQIDEVTNVNGGKHIGICRIVKACDKSRHLQWKINLSQELRMK
ncbi:PREDICTED: uncharacterized protein LOC108558687 isoform X2 [Nicrophorus vespilloides]|uniref:Uncharacterized protein LOC108558687 isoform X2 n=1 Tax=Nicrophorus vespilloides TaxID=110193 RepID=A0ABM1M9B3_NICVS|nr:PREDICTED: uncharacterized protein LOC108558687 isoform X2 [Nicrophorus vespilloides]